MQHFHKNKTPADAGVLFYVLSPGVEPGSQVPQTCILSIELREQRGLPEDTIKSLSGQPIY